jgi:predicted nucleic acid-binding protein
MAVLLDTGILYAFYDRRDNWHIAARDFMENEAGSLIVPSPVLPEVDYLLGQRLGSEAQLLFYRSLSEQDFFVADMPPESYPRILALNRKYRDLRLGFVESAVLALAEYLEVGRIATTDRRHFGAVEVAIPLELCPA